MPIQISYEIIFQNESKIQGQVQTQIGEQLSNVKKKIFQLQELKNQHLFLIQSSNQSALTMDTKVNISMKSYMLVFKQKKQEKEKNFGSVVSVRSRKMSDESAWEQESLLFSDHNQENNFIQQQPQVPPIVCGYVTFPNSFFFCFSSRNYLVLDYKFANFYSNSQKNRLITSVSIQQIREIKSYKRKALYCIRLILNNQTINMKFINKDVCKQWMGYFNQVLNFNHYLKQRKQFSTKQSFQKYVQTILTLKQKQNLSSTKIINLQDQEDTIIESVHTNIPCESSFKKSYHSIIKLQSFEITHRIDEGSFSVIYLANKNNKLIALKQMEKDKLLHKGQIKYALTQLNCLIRAKSCPYIIPLYYAFQTHDYLYLALKYIPYGNLARLIKTKKKLSENDAIILLAELVIAIQFLHDRKILYRDLKPENILLDENGHLYLTDFGLAKELNQNQEAHSFLGTPLYLAPERFMSQGGGIDYKSDIYAVGIIFFQMLHGYHPFYADNFNSVIYNIKNTQIEIDQSLSIQSKSFLQETLQKNPVKRISKMSSHPIFHRLNWKKYLQKQHKGIKIQKQNSLTKIQINYQIDSDYNDNNYPEKKVAKWNYNYEQMK